LRYEYSCHTHGEFEVEQKITDEPLVECPLCKEEGIISDPPKRLISLSSFQLMGGGWAAEGYKK
jgi:putative FmdB family regulatory protein